MSSGRRGLDDLFVDLAEAVDIKVLQRMLGHSSAALTLDRFGHAGSAGGARQPPRHLGSRRRSRANCSRAPSAIGITSLSRNTEPGPS